MKQEVCFIIFKGLSLKQIKSSFLEVEGLAVIENLIFCAILLKISLHSLKMPLKEDSIFSAVTAELLHSNT